MWKVTRENVLGSIGEDEFHSWPGARQEFRYIINEKLGAKGIENFTKQIDDYCKEYYPEGAPENFEQLKTVLRLLMVDPEYPQNPDDLQLDDFDDDNIEFFISDSKKIFIYVNNDDAMGKFPTAEINVVVIDDPTDEYYFFITDNRGRYSINITLAPAAISFWHRSLVTSSSL